MLVSLTNTNSMQLAAREPAPSTYTPRASVVSGQGYVTRWASGPEDVRAAQRLRFEVFAREGGACLRSPVPGLDVDRFDEHCEHLLVRAADTGQVVGTYRLLQPEGARRAGGYYTADEFDLTRLNAGSARVIEIGRSCVHPDHRHGAVLMALWSGLAEAFARTAADMVIGCASIPIADGGHMAVRAWQDLVARGRMASGHEARPWHPLPVDHIAPSARSGDMPPLIRLYVTVGAHLLGPPAWDPDFNVADLPLLVRPAELPRRFRSGQRAYS